MISSDVVNLAPANKLNHCGIAPVYRLWLILNSDKNLIVSMKTGYGYSPFVQRMCIFWGLNAEGVTLLIWEHLPLRTMTLTPCDFFSTTEPTAPESISIFGFQQKDSMELKEGFLRKQHLWQIIFLRLSQKQLSK